MTDEASARVLYVIVCGAGPASDVGQLVEQAHQRDWSVCVLATPAALDFLDTTALEAQTGYPVKSEYRKPGEPRGRASLPNADAIAVAPATYNTVNKWAHGTSDTYALGVLAESLGLGIPVIVVPFVNAALAQHFAFQRSVADLRAAGVRIIHGPGELEPHAPGTGGTVTFPWHRVVDEAEQRTAADK